MELSNRLQSLIDLVQKTDVVADIGCDHGYASIALIQSGRVKHVIAMDINKGPLKRAERNIVKHGLEEHIETRLSNGLEQLQIGEVNLAILAGMGGRLIQSILTLELEKTKMIETLILQPQSELAEVRKILPQIGFECEEEKALIEEGKFYVMMRLKRKDEMEQTWTELELRFGKFLLQKKDRCLYQFLIQKKKEYQKIYESLSSHVVLSKNQKDRIHEIEKELHYIEVAFEYYDREMKKDV